MTEIIGVTGESGAGKGELCRFLKAYGCVIIDCDKISRQVTRRGSACLAGLTAQFGPQILTSDGRLMRRRLAQAAFESRENTERLNALTHPYILAEVDRQLAAAAEKSRIAVLDAPLLATGGLDARCDVIALLSAPQQLRIDRIMRRDGIDAAAAQKRLAARREPELKGKVLKYVNDGDLVALARFAQLVYNTVNK